MYCGKCGHANLDDARYCARCGTEMMANVLPPPPPPEPPPTPAPVVATGMTQPVNFYPVKYAGFWLRFVAFVVDMIILIAIDTVFVLTTFGGYIFSFIFPVAFSWLYYALMESSEKQATLGKLALGLAVTDISHHRISFARATGRHFAKWISGVILFIGYIMAAFTEKKQALHDMLADTLVVRR